MPDPAPHDREALFQAFQRAMEEEARLRELQVGQRRRPDLWEAWLQAMEATDAASRRLREAADEAPPALTTPRA